MKNTANNVRNNYFNRVKSELELKVDDLFEEANGLKHKEPEVAILKLKEANEICFANNFQISLFKLEQLPRLLVKIGQKEESVVENEKVQKFHLEGRREKIKTQWENLFRFQGLAKEIEIKSGIVKEPCPYHKDVWKQPLPINDDTWTNYVSKLYKDEYCRCWFSTVIRRKESFDNIKNVKRKENIVKESNLAEKSDTINNNNQDLPVDDSKDIKSRKRLDNGLMQKIFKRKDHEIKPEKDRVINQISNDLIEENNVDSSAEQNNLTSSRVTDKNNTAKNDMILLNRNESVKIENSENNIEEKSLDKLEVIVDEVVSENEVNINESKLKEDNLDFEQSQTQNYVNNVNFKGKVLNKNIDNYKEKIENTPNIEVIDDTEVDLLKVEVPQRSKLTLVKWLVLFVITAVMFFIFKDYL